MDATNISSGSMQDKKNNKENTKASSNVSKAGASQTSQSNNGTSSPSPLLQVKIEPGLSSTARLSTFRTPRDLNLGGLNLTAGGLPGIPSKQKRVFTPNLNIKREKAVATSSSRSDQTRGGRGRGDGGRGRGRGGKERGRGRGKEFVQAKGVWSDGIGTATLGGSRAGGGASGFGGGIGGGRYGRGGGIGGGGGGGGGNGSSSSIKVEDCGPVRPVVTLGCMNNVDKDEEERMQVDLLRDFIEFGDDDNADHYDQFCPPVTFGAAAATSSDPQIETKQEPDVSTALSNGHAMDSPSPPADSSLLPTVATAHMPPPGSAADYFLRADKTKMSLIRLPNALPSIISRDASSSAKKQAGPVLGAEEVEDSCSRSDRCQLPDLPPGQIGTIRRYRSGKMTFCFGDNEMPCEFDDVPEFIQEVVHSKVDINTRQGRLSVLGEIGSQMLVIPDFEKLLDQRNKDTTAKR